MFGLGDALCGLDLRGQRAHSIVAPGYEQNGHGQSTDPVDQRSSMGKNGPNGPSKRLAIRLEQRFIEVGQIGLCLGV